MSGGEYFLQCSLDQPHLLPSPLATSAPLASHRVRLARAGLPVGKHSRIVALQAGTDEGLNTAVEKQLLEEPEEVNERLLDIHNHGATHYCRWFRRGDHGSPTRVMQSGRQEAKPSAILAFQTARLK